MGGCCLANAVSFNYDVIFVRYEKLFGRLADYNLCVTNAMKEDLRVTCNIQ